MFYTLQLRQLQLPISHFAAGERVEDGHSALRCPRTFVDLAPKGITTKTDTDVIQIDRLAIEERNLFSG